MAIERWNQEALWKKMNQEALWKKIKRRQSRQAGCSCASLDDGGDKGGFCGAEHEGRRERR